MKGFVILLIGMFLLFMYYSGIDVHGYWIQFLQEVL